ncbi:MAG: type I-G CRISPR-associated protein Csb2 [Acidimicrobiia bacterium]
MHATPWGTHVNEGGVEWPPSPWRLLRGLVGTWLTRCEDLAGDVVRPVLGVLAEPPAIRVAARSEASIRSYIPSEAHRRGMSAPDTDLMVDAFAAVAPGSGVSYRWAIDFDPVQRRALERIVEALPYLGRAESVCEASARFDDDGAEGWEEVHTDDSGDGARVLVPTTPLDLDGLCVSIRRMRKGGALHAPGSRWVRYRVPEPVVPGQPRSRRNAPPPAEVVRFALNGAAPVSIRHTLVVAEAMRVAAMSQYGRLNGGGASETLAGKRPDGTPLLGNRHAHWSPLDVDGDGLLDTILVWARAGFDDADLAALGAVRQVRFHGGDRLGSADRLAVALEATVGLDQLVAVGLERLGGASSGWRSSTPFLPQRHPKGQDRLVFLLDCVCRELTARGFDSPFEIEQESETSWGSFRRHRRAERLAQARPGFGLWLRFDRPVGGPIAIGSLSHFGMGQFVHSG